MKTLRELSIKIFADGADLESMRKQADNPLIAGWTTNPTLMRKAGVTDYMAFGREAAAIAGKRPLSLEVFADDLDGMEQQARVLAGLGPNVNVKVPITNTKGESTAPLIKKLSGDGIKLNVTAIFTQEQVWTASQAMKPNPGFISIFAGRIADTGRDPELAIRTARGTCPLTQKLIWASPREVFNVWQADAAGCDIITLSPDLLGKLSLAGKSLEEFSLETVKMFFDDAQKAGYAIAHPASFGGGGFSS
jgi:transaldolase